MAVDIGVSRAGGAACLGKPLGDHAAVVIVLLLQQGMRRIGVVRGRLDDVGGTIARAVLPFEIEPLLTCSS